MVCVPCSKCSSYSLACLKAGLLAESGEGHHHDDSHHGDEGGVEFHSRHRDLVCELLHVIYSRVNHRAAGVYG